MKARKVFFGSFSPTLPDTPSRARKRCVFFRLLRCFGKSQTSQFSGVKESHRLTCMKAASGLEKQGMLCFSRQFIHRSSMKTPANPVYCLTFILLIVSASASNCSNFQGLDACVGNQTEYARIVCVMFYS